MKYKNILAVDPSGSFSEGKGTTGWCIFNSEKNKILLITYLQASNYTSACSYWGAHIDFLKDIHKQFPELMVVIEDYLLYATKAEQQINSRMETSKLIGVLQQYCHDNKISYTMQNASEVKTRWSNEILAYKGFVKKVGNKWYTTESLMLINRHCMDAIRHAVHYNTFKNK